MSTWPHEHMSTWPHPVAGVGAIDPSHRAPHPPCGVRTQQSCGHGYNRAVDTDTTAVDTDTTAVDTDTTAVDTDTTAVDTDTTAVDTDTTA
eukprot:6499642-Pyramimonas_sp.AAC.1